MTAFGARLKLRVLAAPMSARFYTANTRQYHVFSGSKVNDGRSRLSLIPPPSWWMRLKCGIGRELQRVACRCGDGIHTRRAGWW